MFERQFPVWQEKALPVGQGVGRSDTSGVTRRDRKRHFRCDECVPGSDTSGVTGSNLLVLRLLQNLAALRGVVQLPLLIQHRLTRCQRKTSRVPPAQYGSGRLSILGRSVPSPC